MKTIKTTTASIQKFPELFGRVLCEKLGDGCYWTVQNWDNPENHFVVDTLTSRFVFYNFNEITEDLNFTHEAEKAVIKKIGIFEYLNALCKVFYGEQFNLNNYNALLFYQVEDLTTADAPSRLTACLLALNVLEVEDSK